MVQGKIFYLCSKGLKKKRDITWKLKIKKQSIKNKKED